MYLLDANIFMAAARTYYSFDLAPSFWTWLEAQHQNGVFFSIDAVRQEINQGNDRLAQWAASQIPTTFWLQPGEKTSANVAELINWAFDASQQFTQDAKDEFADSADLMLIAQAKDYGAQILTHEVSNPQSKKRILLPDAARILGVRCPSPWEVFSAVGLRL